MFEKSIQKNQFRKIKFEKSIPKNQVHPTVLSSGNFFEGLVFFRFHLSYIFNFEDKYFTTKL